MNAYSDEDKENLFDEICVRVSEGEALRNVLRAEDMPDKNTFYRWIRQDEAKREQYARAADERAEALFEDIIDIADNNTADRCSDNAIAVQRDRLRVDSRKWIASKLNPKKYGDKVDVTSGGKEIKPQVLKIGGKEIEL